MTILSWLFGAPGWLLAGGLILVAVFGLVPSISKWLWVACIVAVGAWGAAGYGKTALQARPRARPATSCCKPRADPCAPLAASCTPPRAR